MRGEIASFCIDVLLAGAGFGVLLAIGLKPRGGLAAVAAAGLAYLVGAAVAPLLLTVLLVLGIPFSLVTFVAVVAVCVLVGVWRAAPTIAAPAFGRIPAGLRSWRRWTADSWAIVVFVLLFAGFAIVGLLSALEMPMLEGDGWTIWARKAQFLTEHDSLWRPFFENPVYAFSHLDYPIQLPVWEALHSRALGGFEEQTLLGPLWILFVAFIWAAAYLLQVFARVRAIVWAPILLLLATAPAIWQQASGAADLPMAMFVFLAVVSFAVWLVEGDNRVLALGAIMLAAAANTKNEGTAVAIAVLLIAGLIVLLRRPRRPFLVAGAGVVVAGILPWRAWLSAHGIEGDIPISKAVDPSYLLDRLDRVWPSVKAINAQFAEQGRWVYLIPLAALMIVAAVASRQGRRLAAFYFGCFLVVWLGFIWTYWISPYELSWHLETSVPRVVTVLVLIAAAAVVHIAGVFVAYLTRPSRQ